MTRNILIIIIAAVFVKLIYFGFAVTLDIIEKKPDAGVNYATLIHSLKKNDAFWYENIANNWYPKIEHKRELGFHEGSEFKQSEWAFFPAYPFMLRQLTNIPGVDIDLAFLLISLIFSLLAFVLFYEFLKIFFENSDKALFVTLLLITFPFHYYFSVFYTEAIFFSFLIGSFLAIQKKRYLLLSFLLIPLTLIRPNGIIMLIPLYLFFLEMEGLLIKKSLGIKKIFQKQNLIRSLYFLTAPLTFLFYGLYQQQLTGEFFAFSIAQQGWYRDFMFPLLALFREGNLANQFNSVYTIAFLLIAIFSWKKLPISLSIFIWLSLLLPLTSGSVQSMPRFISIIFPFSIIIGNRLYQSRMLYLMLSGLFILQLVSYYSWLEGLPISY